MTDLERRLGRGLPYTGGHPQGARHWRTSEGMRIKADGFDYRRNRDGYVVYELCIGASIPGEIPGITTAPVARITSRKIRFMTVVSLGMNRNEVLRLLRDRLPCASVSENSLTYRTEGFFRLNDSDVYRKWIAVLSFTNDRLDHFDITAN